MGRFISLSTRVSKGPSDEIIQGDIKVNRFESEPSGNHNVRAHALRDLSNALELMTEK